MKLAPTQRKWLRPPQLLLLCLISPLWPLHGAPAQTKHEMPENIALERDVRYREGKSAAWKLDLAYPREAGTKTRHAVIVIHGGGWIAGDKSDFHSLQYLAHE